MEISYPRIDNLGESALLVTFGEEITRAANDRVLAAMTKLETLGDCELTPAYTSLLIQFDHTLHDMSDMRRMIMTRLVEEPIAAPTTGRLVRLPVAYGGEYGPDMEPLAASKQISTPELVKLHSGVDYRVYFIGFMPGFPYLGMVPAAIRAPRLVTPRVRVPAGSVGIAEGQTGVYPFASPGGWNLIGRTNAGLWDPYRREPSLLAPGDTVRFLPVESFDDPLQPQPPASEATHPHFQVVSAGICSVQDLGRRGYSRVGLSRGGAMDRAAASRANAALGNNPGAAVLEITAAGPTLMALRTTVIAYSGANVSCNIGGNSVPSHVAWLVRAGQQVRFGNAARGFRAYLAVLGGFDVPPVLGSRSTYLPAGFGGFAGRLLSRGDILACQPDDHSPANVAGRRLGATAGGIVTPVPLRILAYSGPWSAGQKSLNGLCERLWRVAPESDRTGTRLRVIDGQPLERRLTAVVSFGVTQGVVQLPPDGHPVVLNADHQTTGGYPVIGKVIEADFSKLAQLAPGAELRFIPVSLEDALSANAEARRQEEQIRHGT